MKRRLLSLLLVIVLVLGMLPATAMAEVGLGQVRVIVENTTYRVNDGAPWEGILVDTNVDLTEDMTMMTAILTALRNAGHGWNNNSDNWATTYISSIEKDGGDTLGEFTDGTSTSGWKGTLNDWFVNMGFADWKVSEGELVDGDEIRVMYTRNMGADLGGEYGTNQGYLSALSASAGTLAPAFDKETLDYTLTVDSGVSTVNITAAAENKEDKVTVTVGETEYRRGVGVAVENGTEITIACGAQTYIVEVAVEEEAPAEPTPFSQSVTVPSNGDSSWGYVSGLKLSGDDGSIYETYWASESDPFVLDVILGQGTPLDATITATFSVAGLRAPSVSGETSVQLAAGKGTIQVTVVSGISAFYPDTHWTINLTVDDGSAANRPAYAVILPTDTVGYTVTASGSSASPVIEGRKFSFTVNISDDYKAGEDFDVKVNGTELTAADNVYTIENITEDQTVTVEGVVEKTTADKGVTIIAPAGSTISSGRFYSYFKYDFNEPLETTTLEDGRLSVVFPVPGSQGFLRVQHPDGVTYWDFDGLTAGSVFEINSEMLFIGSEEFTKETVYADYEKNIKDKADLYLTANAQGWLDMDTGDTHSLNVFRNWIPVANSISNNGVSLPDVTYTVISPDGTPSDVVTVTPDANNSCYADITAAKAGTAIILVTYDAVYNADGEGGKQFSAIWPENTGVIVVTVDAEDTDIQTNITVNEEANAGGKQILDVEHDILFYVGDAGAEYSFKPEDGCTVTVARSTVDDEMSFHGFTSEGVTVATDGTVTISGLTTGTHIIKVEKDGKTAYQAIRARQVSYELLDAEGNLINAENPADPGETVTVQFHNLVSPLEKLSGVYNANFGFYYNGEDGTEVRKSGGTYGVYTFSGNETLQKFTFTVPDWWNENTLTLTDGGIKLGGFGGSFGAHRSTSYMEGKEVNTNASGTGGVASVLPDIVIPTVPTGVNVYNVTLPVGEGYTVTGGDTPVTEGDRYTFTVKVEAGYDDENMVVKVNGTVVTGTDGAYTVETVTEDLTVTVEGIVEITVEMGETTAVYTNGVDGSGWGRGTYVYVDTVSIGGVEVESYTWDGDACHVTLSSKTEKNAAVGFVINFAGSPESWVAKMVATLNGTSMTAGEPMAVKLKDGTLTVEVYASFNNSNYGGTKTFYLTVAEPVVYTVTLPEGEGYKVSGETTVNGGEDYTFTVTVADGYDGSNMAVAVNGETVTANENGAYTVENVSSDLTVAVSGVVEEEKVATVIAPAGSTVSAGKFHTYYKYDYLDIVRTEILEEGKIAVVFDTSETTGNFYRAQNPDGVTYWNYAAVETGSEYEVTAEDLYIGSTEFTSETVYRFDKNVYDLADIYVNADETGTVNLAVGGTFELNVFRNWMAIEGFTNSKVALPDMEYTVIDMNGDVSDIVTVTPSANNSSVATITANKAGTAVILVTYDAMTHMQGQGGTQFSAIWPENTGVIVVNVGAEGSITTNMTINVGENPTSQKLSGDAIDAEHDILFYVGNEGAEYTFTPEEGCTVSVNRAVVGSSLTYDGFETVKANADGSFTLTGLTTGRHIVKVEKAGEAVYQIIRAREVSYELLDAEGNALSEDYIPTAGDQITIQFSGLTMPVEKQSGVYNFNAKVSYYGEDGTRFPATKGGGFGIYDFSGNAARQKITITIPEEWTGESYTLSGGAIQIGGFGSPAGAHRDTTYAAGKAQNFTAQSMTIVLGQLPEITIGQKKAEEPENPSVTLDDMYEATASTLMEQNVSTGSTNGEWLMFGLARALDKNPTSEQLESYLTAVKSYIEKNIKDGKLHTYKSTDNARVALALTALGYDPADFEGYDLLAAYEDTTWAMQQGNNATAFALLAINAADYELSNEQALISSLLNNQLSDGGWSITGNTLNLDATAMAIQALAPYYKENEAVKNAVDAALVLLADKMTEAGTIDAGGNDGTSAEILAQVIVALAELGRDPANDEQFTKNGKTLIDGLAAFFVGTGFAHTEESSFNQMATEQAFYAMVACKRLAAKEDSLYDMTVNRETKYTISISDATNGSVSASVETAAAGTEVTITVTPVTGYELDTLSVTDASGNAVTVTDNKFTMPASNVTIAAAFKQTEDPAQDVEDAIADMTVTKADADTQEALEALQKAYDALTAEQKAEVVNADELAALWNTFNSLLEEAKDDAENELKAYVADLDEDDYTEDNWEIIEAILKDALTAVEAAENTNEIDAIVSAAKKSIDNVADGDEITVTFRLIGDSQHDDGVNGHEEYVTWIPTTKYTMEPGSTMYDVFMEAIADYGLSQRGAANNYVESIKAPSVLGGYWLGEFDNGTNSGWMYTVNGDHPGVGLKAYELEDGDVIIWHYVDDYVLEERTSSSKYYYRWLEAEDISPEEYLKKQDKDEANTDVESFTDVDKDDWFYKDVQFVVEEGLFNGTGDNKFSPNASMNRAMLVTVLYRLEGEPKVTGSSDFDDVGRNQWYTDAVIWATENEIVNGYGNGKFGPTDNITREQMATILYRYAQYKDYSVKATNSLTGYSDYTQISAYALKSLKWANAEGLINGRTETTLAPQGTATRAEVAAILHRFVENVVND